MITRSMGMSRMRFDTLEQCVEIIKWSLVEKFGKSKGWQYEWLAD
jgi:hypothetical protein